MTPRLFAALCLALLPATGALAQMSVEELRPVVARAFAAAGCVLPLEEGEKLLAEQMGIILDVPWEDLLDRDGIHYDVIDEAVAQMLDSGEVVVDTDVGVVKLADCD